MSVADTAVSRALASSLGSPESLPSSSEPGRAVESCSDEKQDDTSSKGQESRLKLGRKGPRTRIIKSCLTCHANHRKCDKVKPVCGRCARVYDSPSECKWDPRLWQPVTGKTIEDSDDGMDAGDEFAHYETEGVVNADPTCTPRMFPKSETELFSREPREPRSEEQEEGGVNETVAAHEDTSLLVASPFTGVSRTWFEIARSTYDTMDKQWYPNLSVRDPKELYGLYDLWKHFFETADAGSIVICKNTEMERTSLYNTFWALSSFLFACVHAPVNMVSQAKHLMTMTIHVGSQAVSCCRATPGLIPQEISFGGVLLMRAIVMTPEIVDPNAYHLLDYLFGGIEERLAEATAEEMPSLLLNKISANLGRGNLNGAFLIWREERMKERIEVMTSTNSVRRWSFLFLCSNLTSIMLSLCNKSAVHAPNTTRLYDSLTDEWKAAWLDHLDDLEFALSMCTTSPGARIMGVDLDDHHIVSLTKLQECISRWWCGLESDETRIMLFENLRALLQRTWKSLGHPFNCAWSRTLLLALRVLARMHKGSFIAVLGETRVLDTEHDHLLSMSGKNVKATVNQILSATPES